jgi:hypothetical protein
VKDCRVIGEQLIVKDVKGDGRGLIIYAIPEFPWGY